MKLSNCTVRGKLPGKIEKRRKLFLSFEDISKPVRPFFKTIDKEDEVYVSILRMFFFSGVERFGFNKINVT